MAAAGKPCHMINKQDLDDYMKLLSLEKGCPVDYIDRNNAHWEFIFNKEQCLRKVIKYREAGDFSCSICGKNFKHRTHRNRHRRTVKCAEKPVLLEGVKCTICNKLFSSRSNRNRHERSAHKV